MLVADWLFITLLFLIQSYVLAKILYEATFFQLNGKVFNPGDEPKIFDLNSQRFAC